VVGSGVWPGEGGRVVRVCQRCAALCRMAGWHALCQRRRSLCTAVACADGARVHPGCSASPTSRSSETCEPRTIDVITAAPRSLASTSTPRAPAASGRIVTRNGAAWSTRSRVFLCAAVLPRTAVGGVQPAACTAAASTRAVAIGTGRSRGLGHSSPHGQAPRGRTSMRGARVHSFFCCGRNLLKLLRWRGKWRPFVLQAAAPTVVRREARNRRGAPPSLAASRLAVDR
jgi:hypothetical protein